MLETVLQTKLYAPPLRPNLVPRPRLTARLNQNLQLRHKLTLISTPAGFGKTTLASEWLAGCERIPVCAGTAWLSLDEGDNDLTRFLTYFVAALQTLVLPEGAPRSEVEGAGPDPAEGASPEPVEGASPEPVEGASPEPVEGASPEPVEGAAPNIGEGVLGMLQSPEPAPTESILTALLNEISSIPHNFVLVLDDYHLVDAQPVDNALAFLLERMPPQMHLVIATREDPNLPLARLRVRNQLTELRVTDLRFTLDEAAEFLNQVMGLNLSAEEIGSLETRTEGWVAGLQLAALSMQGRADAANFIQAFTGSHRFVLDYLVEEVLQRQPEPVRSFLLQTSILDRLSGPLCDVVTRQEDGKGMLEALERGNLFVVPLDDKRQWYRYHHLFADVLHAHLVEEQPDRVPALHLRASEWYEHNGSSSDAVRHAFAAEDFERAAGLVELSWRAMDRSFQSATWLGWVKALPEELLRARPVLSAEYAWALLDAGELEAAEARLRDAERWLDTPADMNERSETPSLEMVVVDEEEFRSLPLTIANGRAYHAQALGDMAGAVKYSRQALDLLPESDYFERGIQAAVLGLAQWASGDLEAAHRSVADGISNMRMADNILFAISGTSVLTDIRIAQGRLREAVSIYEHALQLALEQGEPALPGTADLYLGLSELFHEQGVLEAAAQHLLKSEELGEQAALPRWKYRLRLVRARLKVAQGDLDGALNLLLEAERLYFRHAIPDVRPVAALKTQVWVAQGSLTKALGWARERGLSVDDDLSYLHEFEYITLARVLIARYLDDRVERPMQESLGLLARLLKVAEDGGRTGSVIEILVLQALAHHAQGDISAALVPLERALLLAEPQGYVRIFVDEGLPMAALLRETAKRGTAPKYVRQLRAAFGKAEGRMPGMQFLIAQQTFVIEPLSERELEVLQLIAQGLSNREIGERLFLALNSVKGHNRRIFAKLQVQRRTEAVARARELGLIVPKR